MGLKRHVIWLAALLALGACRSFGGDGGGGGDRPDGGQSGGDGGGGGGADARPAGDDCDPYSPRSYDPQVLIGPSPFESILLQRIDEAQNSIDVLIYEFHRPSFRTALINAHNRGVNVRVLMDTDLAKNGDTWTMLRNAGIDVRSGPANFDYYHIKSLIIDNSEAVIMSANLVWAHFEITRNYGVILNDPDDLADLKAIFDSDWSGGAPDLACTRLIVSPINANERILGLINSAQSTLELATMYITSDDVMAAIKARHQAGVSVRVMLADPAWISDTPEMASELAAAGVPVRYFKRWDLHAKLVIADGTPFVGSQNMSWTALNKNREVGVFVNEEGAKQQIRSRFNEDWNISVSAP